MNRRNGRLSKRSAVAISAFIIALAAIFIFKVARSDDPAPVEGRTQSESQAQAAPEDERLFEAYFIDVDQGDCELVRIPNSDGSWFNMLIDCGEASQRYSLCEYLEELGIERLDAVVASHLHSDHMGSMATIIKSFDIGSFYMTEVPEYQTPTTVSYEKMLEQLTKKDLKINLIKAGDSIPGADTAAINVLAPNKGAEYESMNNYSAVIKVTYGETSFIYMGDAETENFETALDSGYNFDADVIKIGHHGSHDATNKALLKAVSPEAAVISCGKDNDYGHPHKETMSLLKKNNIDVLRTDQIGTILIESDGKNLR